METQVVDNRGLTPPHPTPHHRKDPHHDQHTCSARRMAGWL